MTIEEIKSRLQLMEVVMHYGLKPDHNGKLCCPFHNDKTPVGAKLCLVTKMVQ